VRIIAKTRLVRLAERHGDCVTQVEDWYSIAAKAKWKSLMEVRESFRHADFVDGMTVFNVTGNDYRLIVTILYENGIIYIKDLLTHAEYERDSWKR
jgi:mRNA interferase HigB